MPPLHTRQIVAPLLILALGSGCLHRENPFYDQNRDLITILDRKDPEGDKKFLVAGKSGEYFYLEDIRAAVTKWHLNRHNLEEIGKLNRLLQSRNIRLILVPAPSKVETYPEKLVDRDTAFICPAKHFFFKSLDSMGVESMDLRQTFFQAKKTHRLYTRTDTHWDQPAIQIAAHLLAARLNLKPRDSIPFTTRDTTLEKFSGDLSLKFIPKHAQVYDTLFLSLVREPSGEKFAEPDTASIVLFGDSFLSQYRFWGAHLGAHLSKEIGVPVKTIYTLQNFVQAPAKMEQVINTFPEIRVIFWVITSRTMLESM